MKRETKGELIFWAATVCGLALYFFSSPVGLPWNGSTQTALAWAGEIVKLPVMPNPVWGYFIQVFGGKFVAVSSVAAALTAGLLGAVINRYLGWRVAAAGALTWLFLPSVWERAVTGERVVFWGFGLALALWIGNALFLLSSRRARKVAENEKMRFANTDATLSGIDRLFRQFRNGRITGWALLGASALFAVISAARHDYTIGEVASVYARAVLDEAGGRIVIMGGVADEQMIWEAERREQGASARLVTLRNDDAYRAELVARVKRDWPGETNLWVAAQIGPKSFAELAVKEHPERFYQMTGRSTTPERWAARWEAMKPYLASSDRFVPVMRRAFAFEANTLGGRMQDENRRDEAWNLYWRIITEVDADNLSAYVNLHEMLRRGYQTDSFRRDRIRDGMARLCKGFVKGQAMTTVLACGPVHPDAELLAKFREELEQRVAELEREGKVVELPDSMRSLLDCGNAMIRAFDAGDFTKAGRYARAILSRSDGRGFIPANAVMGALMAKEGDYVASEAFYRTVFAGREKPPPAVYNDFADTLKHLGRLDEAERIARLGIAEADEQNWILRLTLAEILRDAKKNAAEINTLLKSVYRSAPEQVRTQTTKDFLRK